MSRSSLPVVASLLTLTSVTAAQQPAHVHGIATLNLAMEGDKLEIEFVSPAGNIVGFEHEAVTAAERRAIRDAIEQLMKGNEQVQTSRATLVFVSHDPTLAARFDRTVDIDEFRAEAPRVNVLRLAWKSLLNRRDTASLTVLTIAVSVALLLGVEKVRSHARRWSGSPMAKRSGFRVSYCPLEYKGTRIREFLLMPYLEPYRRR